MSVVSAIIMTMLGAPPPTQIDSWQKAEENAATWMRHWGFDDAVVTAAGPDGGIDVTSKDALAQVKFEAAQVGTPAVQRLVGARGRDQHKELLFFSGAGFSTPAIAYADDMDIALFFYDLVGRTTPMSRAAREVIFRRSRQEVDEEASVHAPSLTVRRQPVEVVTTKTNRLARNWPAIGAFVFVVGAIGTTAAMLDGTDDPHITWADPIRNALLVVPFLILWIWTRARKPLQRTTTTHLVDAPDPQSPIGAVDPRTLPSVMALIRDGKTIHAVSEYRNVTGLRLKEAKDAVDAVR